jgi:hypothetical protein
VNFIRDGVAKALEGDDGAIDHEVHGEGARAIGHEVTGRLSEAVRHEVAGEQGELIRHQVAEVRVLPEAVPVRVEPVDLRLGGLRLRLPVDFTLRFSLFGREIARLDGTGTARVEGE